MSDRRAGIADATALRDSAAPMAHAAIQTTTQIDLSGDRPITGALVAQIDRVAQIVAQLTPQFTTLHELGVIADAIRMLIDHCLQRRLVVDDVARRRAADLAPALKRWPMQVLCALGARDGAALVQRLLAQLGGRPLDLTLVFVIDEGLRHGIEALRGAFHRGPRLGAERRAQIRQAEERSGEVVLAEARAVAEHADGVAVTTRLLRGRPERVIVELAGQGVDLAVVSAREGVHASLAGPESIGHVARYVLDHAPCDVLLLRHH